MNQEHERPPGLQFRMFGTRTTRVGGSPSSQAVNHGATAGARVDTSPTRATGLVEECPACSASEAPSPPPLPEEVELLWDAGDPDLRSGARETARQRGYVEVFGMPVHHSAFQDHDCQHCLGAAVVPALPLDMQPHHWLYEVTSELAERLAKATESSDALRVALGRLEAVQRLLLDLPPLPPDSWWPASLLDQRHGDEDLADLYDQLDVDPDDVPF